MKIATLIPIPQTNFFAVQVPKGSYSHYIWQGNTERKLFFDDDAGFNMLNLPTENNYTLYATLTELFRDLTTRQKEERYGYANSMNFNEKIAAANLDNNFEHVILSIIIKPQN